MMENLLFLILGVILSYALEFTRPWVLSFIKNQSLSMRERKITNLITHYDKMKEHRENPTLMVLAMCGVLGWSIVVIGVLVIFLGSASTSYTAFSLALVFFIVYLTKTATDAIDKVLNFEKFEKKTLSQLEKLGISMDEARALASQKNIT